METARRNELIRSEQNPDKLCSSQSCVFVERDPGLDREAELTFGPDGAAKTTLVQNIVRFLWGILKHRVILLAISGGGSLRIELPTLHTTREQSES